MAASGGSWKGSKFRNAKKTKANRRYRQRKRSSMRSMLE